MNDEGLINRLLGAASVSPRSSAGSPPLPIGQTSASAGRIVLSWLIRLRWLAVAGQLFAIGVAVIGLELSYPLVPLAAVLLVTLLTNIGLAALLHLAPAAPTVQFPQWLMPAVLLLDVLLLTVLLYYTGGPENPFAVLFVIHVAMATLVLGPGWGWVVVTAVGLCYGAIALWHRPLTPGGENLPAWAQVLGHWTALLLVAALLAYFIGRVMLALRTREQELAAMRERAVLNERLASLTTLAAGAAHELGTPLGTIAVVAKEMELEARRLGEAGSLEAPPESAGSIAEDAALIRQQVERCRQILDRMRGDIAGRSSDEPGRCAAEDVVQAVLAQLRPEARRQLNLTASESVPDLAAPLRAVQQAVQFLVNNAIDASEPGERVDLSVTAGEGLVRFTVTDRGTGMDPQTLRRAIEPFFTTKEPGRGMGLGLFLVRLVAERNGGRLMLDSEPGRGTTAVLELPAVGGSGGNPAL